MVRELWPVASRDFQALIHVWDSSEGLGSYSMTGAGSRGEYRLSEKGVGGAAVVGYDAWRAGEELEAG